MKRSTNLGQWCCVLSVAACLPAGLAVAAEPNDDFADRTVITAGQLSVDEELLGDGNFPDTLMRALNDLGAQIAFDDDSSTLGDGLASGLFNIPVNADGSINLQVTGVGDDTFDGFHGEFGAFELFVEVFDSSGTLLDSLGGGGEGENELFQDVLDFDFTDAAWIGGTFSAEIDNSIGNPDGGDVDFFEFTGLTPGATLFAETSLPGGDNEDLDPVVGWFDEFGNLIATDDDSSEVGNGLQSLLEVTVDANGHLVIGVTGYPDFDFNVGSHPEAGEYTLTLSDVPEPATLALLSLGGLAMLRRRA